MNKRVLREEYYLPIVEAAEELIRRIRFSRGNSQEAPASWT